MKKIFRKKMKRLIPVYAVLTTFALLIAASCASSENGSGDEPVIPSANTLVASFYLQKDDSVMAMLDSVKFTVDVDKQLIYNADSLPKGTKINRLLANITLASLTSVGEITINGAETMNDTTYTYTNSTTDSIDFTGKVYLTVRAADEISIKRYEIRVNVHQIESDSLYWNQLARRDLPAYSMELLNQKTVMQGDKLFCLIEEESRYTISSTTTPEIYNSWNKQSADFGFKPDISSFCATSDALYILDAEGALYRSSDGTSWEATGKKYKSLIAGYGDRLLALSFENGTYFHETYTPNGVLDKKQIDNAFPIKGFSQPCTYSSEWSMTTQLFIIGGTQQDGVTTGDLWGYDGTNWEKLSNKSVPPMTGITLFPYYSYRQINYNYVQFPVLLAIGGKKADGTLTNDVYISFDNGVNWKIGDDLIQLPDYIPESFGAQAFVVNSTLTRSANSGWEQYAPKPLPVWWAIDYGVSTRASQAITSWECPYIYMFGGYSSQGTLFNNIWKGVINRLTFKPLI